MLMNQHLQVLGSVRCTWQAPPHPTPARGGPAGVTAGVAVDFCGQQT